MQEASARDHEQRLEASERTLIEREAARQANGRCLPDWGAAARKPYQLCSRTVMDTTDPEITFDATGASSWVHRFEREVSASWPTPERRNEALTRVVAEIKSAGAGKSYDCVIGLSGGVDSSYLCILAQELGLRPLVVHFDNGWNSELAIQNIERIVTRLKLDLNTFVMNWPEFRDLQRSYFKASVLDLEVPTDHMIFGAVYRVAAKAGIRHIISGHNLATEWVLPRTWYYPKFDLANIQDIQRRYGTMKLKELPALGLVQSAWYHQIRRLRSVALLDLVDYDKPAAKRRLIDELGWRDYGGKHHESVFTRFYQGHILPNKFNIDKRKAHLSNLVLTGHMSRSDAIEELLQPPYAESTQKEDFVFVAKKLGFSEAEFAALLVQPNRSHEEFASDRRPRARYQKMLYWSALIKQGARSKARSMMVRSR